MRQKYNQYTKPCVKNTFIMTLKNNCFLPWIAHEKAHKIILR